MASDDKIKILIIDDSQFDIFLTRNILKNDQTNISFAMSGEEGIEKMKQSAFDLVLLDIRMPEMDGFAVYDKMQKDPTLKEVPVIFLSVEDGFEGIAKSWKTGAWGYILKGSDGEVIRARVRNVLLRSQERKRDKEKIADLSARRERTIPAIKEKLEHIRDKMYAQKKSLAPNDVKADKIEAVVKDLEEINALIDDICGDRHPN